MTQDQPINWRALCEELVNELHGYASANPHHDSDVLVARTRAALAKPVAPLPDREDVTMAIAFTRQEAVVAEEKNHLVFLRPQGMHFVADLLQTLSSYAFREGQKQ